MNVREIPTVALVDLCEKYGWRRCGPDYDIMRWLENMLALADKCSEEELEDLRERADQLRDAEDRIEKLEGIVRSQAKAVRAMADELLSLAQQHEDEADV